MHLPSLDSCHIHFDMKLFMRAQNGSCSLDSNNSGESSTRLCSLRSAGCRYNISLCHTNLTSNRFFVKCARLWNSLSVDMVSKGHLPSINRIIKYY